MKETLNKKFHGLVVKPYLKWYLKKVRDYSYEGIRLKIRPGVFHPGFFFSTQTFVEFISNLNLKGKTVCEVGAGSALLSFISYAKGARVCSLDINPDAISGIRENLKANFTETNDFQVYQSDLFNSVPPQKFEVLLVNPPYFFRNPGSNLSYGWYCGENGEFFHKLFSQASEFTFEFSKIYMVLAENCDLKRISDIADSYKYCLTKELECKIKWEKNYIFSIGKI